MRSSLPHLLAACLSAACLIPPLAFSQGSLTPPGPPAPTMKTLDQIDAKLEKRIPINAVNTPGNATSTFRIAAPGSYYLTGNVTGESGKNGIFVDADNVTIDLNGFTLLGVPGSLTGILPEITSDESTVRNGYVSGWGGRGVLVGRRSRVDHIIATLNGVDGIGIGQGGIVADCGAHNNTDAGISVAAGSVIRSCVAVFNGGIGFEASETGLIVDCVSRNNTGNGFTLGNVGTIRDCVASFNEAHGITIQSGQVLDCLSSSNTLDGISNTSNFGLNVQRCTAVSNQGNGIKVAAGSTVAHNRVTNNGQGAGIRVESGQGSRIDSNNVAENARGIEVVSDRNIIIRNTCRNNGARNFVIAAGNRIAQILVPAVNAAAIDGDTGAGTFTSTDPWANFSY